MKKKLDHLQRLEKKINLLYKNCEILVPYNINPLNNKLTTEQFKGTPLRALFASVTETINEIRGKK